MGFDFILDVLILFCVEMMYFHPTVALSFGIT